MFKNIFLILLILFFTINNVVFCVLFNLVNVTELATVINNLLTTTSHPLKLTTMICWDQGLFIKILI